MTQEIAYNRRLAPFPETWNKDEPLHVEEWLDDLLSPDGGGYLVHGGPGSGKSAVMNYLRTEINEEEGWGYVIGPLNMAAYRGETRLNVVLSDLAAQILDQASQHPAGPQIPELPSDAINYLPVRTSGLVSQALTTLSTSHSGRTILLLDNYDLVHPLVAVRLAGHLRTWYDDHKQHFTFVLTTATDLDELRAVDVYSPLVNVCDAYLLLDLDFDQTRRFAQREAEKAEQSLSETELSDLWHYTRGYPALITGLLASLFELRRSQSDASVSDGVAHSLARYARREPLRSATRRIEELANLNAQDYNPAQLLDDLLHGKSLRQADRASRLLLALGIIDWDVAHVDDRFAGGASNLTWRNPFIQQFFETNEVGKRMVANWVQRPLSFREGQLSAQGAVIVSLFVDLGPWLSPAGHSGFDNQRGTAGWRDRLRELSENEPLWAGSFTPWAKQSDLINIGHDLNLFRQQVHDSFMPTYEAQTDAENLNIDWDALLDRLGDVLDEQVRDRARDVLKQEWRRWDQVRVQLTRDGAAHVALVREIDSPLPVMQILDELLGLERELLNRRPDQHLIDLSVQWEIVLAVLDTFFRQVAGDAYPHIPTLGFNWEGLARRSQTGNNLYPSRDRYVVFALRKLCNCRQGGLRPDRDLITIERDLAPLMQDKITPAGPAYDYGKELTCLLEGVMIRVPDENGQDRQAMATETGRFPDLKPREIQSMLKEDLASWQNELFVASLDNAIIIYQAAQKLPPGRNGSPPANGEPRNLSGARNEADNICLVCRDWEKQTIKDLYFPQRTVSYQDYWQCVTLGLQYVIELRWATQWVARRTTSDLARLADVMDQPLGQRDPREIDGLGKSIALSTRLLAHLRDASIPMSIASTDYAARKYEHIINVSGLRETIRNAEKNIASLNTFINHHTEQDMQRVALLASNTAERQNERLNHLSNITATFGLILAIIALVVTIPSMWLDFSNKQTLLDFLRKVLKGEFTSIIKNGAFLFPFIVTVLIFLSGMIIVRLYFTRMYSQGGREE